VRRKKEERRRRKKKEKDEEREKKGRKMAEVLPSPPQMRFHTPSKRLCAFVALLDCF